jgi:hypothetical protein
MDLINKPDSIATEYSGDPRVPPHAVVQAAPPKEIIKSHFDGREVRFAGNHSPDFLCRVFGHHLIGIENQNPVVFNLRRSPRTRFLGNEYPGMIDDAIRELRGDPPRLRIPPDRHNDNLITPTQTGQRLLNMPNLVENDDKSGDWRVHLAAL